MEKYFVTQLKKLWKILPLVICITVLLFGGIYLAYQGLIAQWTQKNSFQKISIAMVGTAEDRFLDIGLNVLKTMDSSNMSVAFLALDEAQARTALEKGEIAAYIVFPDEFLDNALGGKLTALHFVSTAGSENIVSLVKDELTSAIASILIASERGAFGLADALIAFDQNSLVNSKMNEISIEYAKQVLDRELIYTVEELGVSDGLRFEEYMLCGLSVVFLYLMTLPFVSVFVKDAATMEQLLKSRGIGAGAQVLCELSAYTLFLLLLTVIPAGFLIEFSFSGFLHVIPVVFSVAGISYLIYSLSRDLISGVLLQLITAIALCFVSGCMYPVYFFPVSVQKLADYLPAAIARIHLAELITADASTGSGWILCAIGLVCAFASVPIRYWRIDAGKEGRS